MGGTGSITYRAGGLDQIMTIRDMDEMNRAVNEIVDGGGISTDVSVKESDRRRYSRAW